MSSVHHARRWTRWLWIALASAAAVVITVLALASAVPVSSETLRRRLIATLSDRLESDVELLDIHIRVLPRFHAEGFGLTIRQKRRHDMPALIAVRRFSVDADLVGLWRKHVTQVTLDGLEITIPPHHTRANEIARPSTPAEDANDRQTDAQPTTNRATKDVILDHVVSTDARLVIIPDRPDRPPKVWAIHDLHMRTVAFDRAMPFEATLTNAIPPGEIATQGIFGPWRATEPGATALEGTFRFAHADLGIFKGISGVLSAHGEFGGSLGRLGIHGETETPDFTVAVGGHAVSLHTDYHATVDGTNGDTRLDRIDGSFLQSHLIAKGSVLSTPGKDGRTVTLDVSMDHARLEDVLRLAVKTGKPPLTGALTLTTKLVLPPGDRDVVDKLRLNGQFVIGTARFTDLDIQNKVNELSHRSRGESSAVGSPHVVSNFNGRFRLSDGTLALPSLTFDTAGTVVRLAGSYQLRPERLDFKGTLLMDAKISETQTGIKRVLLKAIDPLFKKEGGGSAIPIKIEGQRDNPSFGLDKSRVFTRHR